jgi:phage gpG-like protein
MANNFETIFKSILKAVKTELHEEFDKNFQSKSFFGDKWADTKHQNRKGSLMMRTGALRRGQQSRVEGDRIIFTNTQPYAAIHNEGGTITVTAAMKKFFWAMYYQAVGKMTKRKDGARSASKRNVQLTADAAYWKSLALMKVGSKVKIPKRQFVGWHPIVQQIIQKQMEIQLKNIEEQVTKMLRK